MHSEFGVHRGEMARIVGTTNLGRGHAASQTRL
jgi:hypothetical protein